MKNLDFQKRIASSVLKCSKKRVVFDVDELESIKEAITRSDIKSLISEAVVVKKQKKGVSRVRANFIKRQKAKGQRKGHGSRKGKATARTPKKETWMAKIRLQRKFIKSLKDLQLIDNLVYRQLYLKCKGGFFRSKRHIKLYLNEHNLFLKKE
ncbi:MAG: 50S ribosomal protein L19e [Candidatus Woesearchaeota archaeon]